MSGPPVRVGVAGCGGMSRRVHLPLLSRMPGVRVVAIADHNQGALALAATLVPNAAVFNEVAAMLAQADIDAVIVALPTFAHADVSVAVLESGRHLYVESPLASEPAEGRRMVDLWRRSGRVGLVGLSARYHPLLLETKRLIDDGAIGSVMAARIAFTSRRGSRPAWAGDPARGGGVLLDKAYHEIDVVRVLLGDIEDVFCTQVDRGARPETVALQLRCERGCVAQLSISIASVADARLDIYGEKGRLSFGRYDSLRVTVDPLEAGGIGRRVQRLLGEAARAHVLWRKLRSPGHDPSFAAALDVFVTAIRNGGTLPPGAPTLADGLACLDATEAARLSLHERRPIAIRDLPSTDR